MKTKWPIINRDVIQVRSLKHGERVGYGMRFVNVYYEMQVGVYRCFVHTCSWDDEKFQVTMHDCGGGILTDPAKTIEEAISEAKHKLEMIMAIGGPNGLRHKTAYKTYWADLSKHTLKLATDLLTYELL